MIEPKILKGFRDLLPATMIDKKKLIAGLENLFTGFGFDPIDTPALEYTEILLGKGSGETDKQIYRFKDHGGRDVSLRFDLTVPLARFVSLHKNELIFPFKRYHIAPVWRGENTQKGRYREFYQCDFDILGTEAVASDIEILLVIYNGFKILNAGTPIININNRMILNNTLIKLKIHEKSADILRTIDKIYKIGEAKVIEELTAIAGLTLSQAQEILKLLKFEGLSNNYYEVTGSNIFKALTIVKENLGSELAGPVIMMETVFKTLEQLGVLDNFAYNPAITRGLDYYTGIVFESFIEDKREFGSVCSGGRYDNLTGLYSKTPVSGIGGSFGLDRLLALMEDKSLLSGKKSVSEVIIFNLSDNHLSEYYKLASVLRENGINSEVIYEAGKLAGQFKYAEKKGVRYVVIAGTDELTKGVYNLKEITTGKEFKEYNAAQIINEVKGK